MQQFLIPPPATGGPAWQDQSAFCHRKADFLGIYLALESFQLRGNHIGQHGGSQSCGIGIYQEKQGVLAQKLHTQPDEGMDRVLDFPDLAFGAPKARSGKSRTLSIPSSGCV